MTGYFFDTSALAKAHHKEKGTGYVIGLLTRTDIVPYISRLTTLELVSVFTVKVRTGEMDLGAAAFARRKLDGELGGGRILIADIVRSHYGTARALIDKHGITFGLRSLDALQIAVALDLRSAALVSVFVSADRRQLRAAQLEGFVVADPENASFSTQ